MRKQDDVTFPLPALIFLALIISVAWIVVGFMWLAHWVQVSVFWIFERIK